MSLPPSGVTARRASRGRGARSTSTSARAIPATTRALVWTSEVPSAVSACPVSLCCGFDGNGYRAGEGGRENGGKGKVAGVNETEGGRNKERGIFVRLRPCVYSFPRLSSSLRGGVGLTVRIARKTNKAKLQSSDV